jgi:uncharacterized membrane protein
MAKTEKTRLDQPVTPRRMPSFAPTNFEDGVGRFSERIARFLGTGRYLFLQTVIVIFWLICNAIPALQFDKYPYLFLTLALSLQASYAAPLILLAQNRQADRDRVALEEDRAQYSRNLADTEYLTRELASLRQAVGDVATRDFIRSELRSLLETLDEEAATRYQQERKERKKAEKKLRQVTESAVAAHDLHGSDE